MSSTDNDLACDVVVVGAGPAGENVADRVVHGEYGRPSSGTIS